MSETGDTNKPTLPHPYSEKWSPYLSPTTGEVVTITWDQVAAVHQAVRCVEELRRESAKYEDQRRGKNPPLSEDFYGAKSRALGRLLVDGKPLFEDLPPYEFGAAGYAAWDAENERG